MAEKMLNTRILLKYDSYANWSSKNPVLRQGEVAIAYVAESHTQLEGKDQHPVMFKVGPGNFNDLPWASALAADVHAWAKKSEAEFKTWVKGIIEVTDIDAYSKGQIDTMLATQKTNLEKYADDAVAAEAAIARAAEKANEDAIKVLNGDATTAGSVAKAVADAKSELQGVIDGVEDKVDQNTTDIATNLASINAINDAEDGILAQAKVYAQGLVDDLAEVVGEIPADAGVETVIAYVDKKTTGIASDTKVQELETAVGTAQAAIDAIEEDYLKAADKTELEGKITAEAERADAAEKANAAAIKVIQDDYLTSTDAATLQGNIDAQEDRIDAIVADYLKAADKTELKDEIKVERERIDVIAGDYVKAADIADFATDTELATAVSAEESRAKGVEESLQTQINTIMNNPDTEGVINSINEFTQYIEDHGEIAEGFRTDIDANKRAIEDEAAARATAEGLLDGRLDVLEAIDHDAYIAADTALEGRVNAEIAKKADQTALENTASTIRGEIATQVAADKERFEAIEAQLGEGEGSVSDQIADAKDAAIEAAAADATAKADAAQAAAIAAAKTETETQVATALGTAATDAQNKADAALAAAKEDAQAKADAAKDAANANTAEVIKNYYTKSEADAAFLDQTEVNTAINNSITALKLSETYEPIGAEERAIAAAEAYADGLAGNYATAAQGAKADTALQEITADTGLIVTDKNQIGFDPSTVFVFNCGSASELVD